MRNSYRFPGIQLSYPLRVVYTQRPVTGTPTRRPSTVWVVVVIVKESNGDVYFFFWKNDNRPPLTR